MVVGGYQELHHTGCHKVYRYSILSSVVNFPCKFVQYTFCCIFDQRDFVSASTIDQLFDNCTATFPEEQQTLIEQLEVAQVSIYNIETNSG